MPTRVEATVDNPLGLHARPAMLLAQKAAAYSSEITIGRKDADPVPTICLTGLGVQKFHAVIKKTDDGFKIAPGASNAKVKINGVPITSEVCLNNKDRVVLGSNHVYVFSGKFQSI